MVQENKNNSSSKYMLVLVAIVAVVAIVALVKLSGGAQKVSSGQFIADEQTATPSDLAGQALKVIKTKSQDTKEKKALETMKAKWKEMGVSEDEKWDLLASSNTVLRDSGQDYDLQFALRVVSALRASAKGKQLSDQEKKMLDSAGVNTGDKTAVAKATNSWKATAESKMSKVYGSLTEQDLKDSAWLVAIEPSLKKMIFQGKGTDITSITTPLDPAAIQKHLNEMGGLGGRGTVGGSSKPKTTAPEGPGGKGGEPARGSTAACAQDGDTTQSGAGQGGAGSVATSGEEGGVTGGKSGMQPAKGGEVKGHEGGFYSTQCFGIDRGKMNDYTGASPAYQEALTKSFGWSVSSTQTKTIGNVKQTTTTTVKFEPNGYTSAGGGAVTGKVTQTTTNTIASTSSGQSSTTSSGPQSYQGGVFSGNVGGLFAGSPKQSADLNKQVEKDLKAKGAQGGEAGTPKSGGPTVKNEPPKNTGSQFNPESDSGNPCSSFGASAMACMSTADFCSAGSVAKKMQPKSVSKGLKGGGKGGTTGKAVANAGEEGSASDGMKGKSGTEEGCAKSESDALKEKLAACQEALASQLGTFVSEDGGGGGSSGTVVPPSKAKVSDSTESDTVRAIKQGSPQPSMPSECSGISGTCMEYMKSLQGKPVDTDPNLGASSCSKPKDALVFPVQTLWTDPAPESSAQQEGAVEEQKQSQQTEKAAASKESKGQSSKTMDQGTAQKGNGQVSDGQPKGGCPPNCA